MAKKFRQSRFHFKQSTRASRGTAAKKTSQISFWKIRSYRTLHYLLVWINKLQVKIQWADKEKGFEGIFDIVSTKLLLLIFVTTDSPHTEKACVHQAAQIRRILLVWSLLRMYNHTTWIIWHECRILLLQSNSTFCCKRLSWTSSLRKKFWSFPITLLRETANYLF